MLVKDIMRRDVVSVEADWTIPKLVKAFQEHGITGAPVVDRDGSVIGVVSQTDVVGARRGQPPSSAAFHAEPEDVEEAVGMHVEECDDTRVEQIMTPGAITFDESATVAAVAKAMLERHIHRVLITREDRLCGIVTTMDMLKVVARMPLGMGPRERPRVTRAGRGR